MQYVTVEELSNLVQDPGMHHGVIHGVQSLISKLLVAHRYESWQGAYSRAASCIAPILILICRFTSATLHRNLICPALMVDRMSEATTTLILRHTNQTSARKLVLFDVPSILLQL